MWQLQAPVLHRRGKYFVFEVFLSLVCSLSTKLIDFRPISTTEPLGTAPLREEYNPQIFAHVNYAYHVFWDWYGGTVSPKSGPEQFLDSYISVRYNFEHELEQ